MAGIVPDNPRHFRNPWRANEASGKSPIKFNMGRAAYPQTPWMAFADGDNL
jgi:hypothetical protein